MDLAFWCESTEGLRHGDRECSRPSVGHTECDGVHQWKDGQKGASQGEAETERNRETEV